MASEITIVEPWVQLPHPGRPARDRWVLHIPRAHQRLTALCAVDLTRAEPVTPDGAYEGRLCGRCERLGGRP